MRVKITHCGPSTCSDHEGAVDASLTIGTRECEVTLLPSDQDGVLGTWGSLDHWANYETMQTLDAARHKGGDFAHDHLIDQIVEAVQAAAE